MTMPIKSRATLMMSRISTFEWKLLVINCARMVGDLQDRQDPSKRSGTAIISARGPEHGRILHEQKDFRTSTVLSVNTDTINA